MYGILRQSTATTVLSGPFLAPGDGITAKTALSAPASAGSGAATGVALVKNGVAAGYTLSGWAHDRLGYYTTNLASGDVDTLGRVRLEFVDPANYCPVHMDFLVLSAAVWDWFFGATAPYTGTPPTPPTAAAIVTAIWTDLLASSDFSTAASVGKLIKDNLDAKVSLAALASQIPTNFTAATFASAGVFSTTALANAPTGGSAPTVGQIATALMANLLSGTDFNTAGSFGKLIKDNLDAKVSGATSLTALQVENAVWNAALSAHSIAGSAGANLEVAGSPVDPWSINLTAYAPGTAGFELNSVGGIAVDGGTVAASPTPTLTTFTATGAALHAPSGGYPIAPMWIYWQDGPNQGLKVPIFAHTVSGGNHNFIVATMPSAAGAGNTFIII